MKSKFVSLMLFCIALLCSESTLAEVKNTDTISQERYDRVCKWGILNPPECKKEILKTSSESKNNSQDYSKQATQKKYNSDCRWGILNPPKCKNKSARDKAYIEERNKKKVRSFEEENNNISVYTGTFDIKDKERDDKTTLLGIEHKNTDLFRDTWLGRLSPTTGAFVTGKNSVYLYTGIEADYNLGRINISPSFAPGYYEAGDGKNLGSALEFKSEVKIGIDLFKNTNLGYSYSHISNNEWGNVNPGIDNQSLTFSQKF